MFSFSDLHDMREAIIQMAQKHGASNVRVFGSVVRGESSAESDVDILVHMDSGRSLLDRIALIQELEDLLHCKVDVVNEQALSSVFKAEVLTEAVEI